MVVVLQDVRTSLVFKWKVIFCLVSPFGRLYEEFSESQEKQHEEGKSQVEF